MVLARRLWGLRIALYVHLGAAPALAFFVSAIHELIEPQFSPLLRAAVTTGLVITLDGVVVAPVFERSYEMFRSLIGTWVPFVLIFIASLSAGLIRAD